MITVLEIWLLGVALAMDCFSVSIAQGLTARRVIWPGMTAMALSFGIFQGGMTLLGYIGTSLLSHHLRHLDIIAVIILFYLGSKMLWDGIRHKDGTTPDMLKPLNILTLSVATSMDALAVGISFACLRQVGLQDVLAAAAVIGFCSTLFSTAGLWLGIGIGRHINLRSEVMGGIILICIGIKILKEYLI